MLCKQKWVSREHRVSMISLSQTTFLFVTSIFTADRGHFHYHMLFLWMKNNTVYNCLRLPSNLNLLNCQILFGLWLEWRRRGRDQVDVYNTALFLSSTTPLQLDVWNLMLTNCCSRVLMFKIWCIITLTMFMLFYIVFCIVLGNTTTLVYTAW